MVNDDLDRTVIMPTPGRRRGTEPAAPNVPIQQPTPSQPVLQPSGQAEEGEEITLQMIGSSGQNHLVNSATMVFSLARQLRNTAEHQDIPGLLQHVTSLVQQFEKNCVLHGIGPDVAYEARYILCAFLDEIVLNTPWGNGSVWSQQSLLSTLHDNTSGGERFFQVLARKSDTPAQNIDLLELMYHCLRLGFQGKFAIQDGGQAALEQISNGLFQTIRNLRGDPDLELSPMWEGVSDGRPMVAKLIPWWVVGAVFGGILVLTYTGFFFALNDESDSVFSDIGKLGREVPQMVKARTAMTTLVDPVETGIDTELLKSNLQSVLQQEITDRKLTLSEQPFGLKITIHNKGLFASGSAGVSSSHVLMLDKLATALEDLPGPIVVSGHSDSQKIRTLRFPSNWHLSDERARSIVELLVEAGMDKDKLVAQGKADTEPVASNGTAEGREQNRRVEILIRSF